MSVKKMWFFVTPMTSVFSIFAFAFGVSLLSYFLTGQETVDMWTVLKVLETLPDPREFINTCMIFYNFMTGLTKQWGVPPSAPTAIRVIFGGLLMILKAIIYIGAIVGTVVISAVLFPLYTVFFTVRCCGAMLVLIGVDLPFSYNVPLDEMFHNILGF